MTDKKILLGLAALMAAAPAQAQSADPSRPNIVLFMVDDMGWQDTSLPFTDSKTPLNQRFHTPNMERLAQMGTKFTSAYACSISSPSRCSLMTGMNQARHRVTNWTLHKDQQTDENNPTLNMPNWNYNGIQPMEGINNTAVGTSFVTLLRDAGYHTIHVGKAHFGARNTPSEDPTVFGFDVNIAGHAAGGPASYLGEDHYGVGGYHNKNTYFGIPDLEAYWDKDVFATEALTLEAIKALDQHRAARQDSPFYLYMAHYAVHVPLDKDSRFYDKYRAAGLDDTESRYAALVEGMDKSLGDILDYLEDTKQIDNTVIIFMSDNGGLDYGARGATPDGRGHNAPLRAGKGSAYEGGTREPMIVYWKDHATPGAVVDDYLIIEDFYPTILEMAGVTDYEVPQTIDGRSFLPLLQGQHINADRVLVWNTPHTWLPVGYQNTNDANGKGYGQTCAIRQGDWKLIYYYWNGHKQLYNLKDDLSETTNLASAHPDVVERLSSALGQYLRDVDGQRPTFKDTGLPCPWPDEEWNR